MESLTSQRQHAPINTGSTGRKSRLFGNPDSPESRGPIASLAQLLLILDAFNHRNKNQHRASHWWSDFDLLRRSIRRITSPPRQRNNPSSLPSQARWLCTIVVPRAYVVFTQLAADNQYAPLGLMLIAALARAHSLISELLPTEEDVSPVQVPKPSQVPPPTQEGPRSLDKGIAVSRKEVPAVDGGAVDATSSNGTKHESMRNGVTGKRGKVKSKIAKHKKQKDQLSSLFSSLV